MRLACKSRSWRHAMALSVSDGHSRPSLPVTLSGGGVDGRSPAARSRRGGERSEPPLTLTEVQLCAQTTERGPRASRLIGMVRRIDVATIRHVVDAARQAQPFDHLDCRPVELADRWQGFVALQGLDLAL